MECPFCYTNFEYHLSICPHCAKATDDPLYQELFSRVKPRKIEKAAPKTEENSAAAAAAAAAVEAAARPVEEIQPAQVFSPPEVKERPAVTAEIKTKDTSSTLVDFPGKKAELPEWRLELQARLREIQDQRGGAPETSTEALTAKKHAIGGTGLAMAVLETPETPTHPLMQRALERIERSRLNNEEKENVPPASKSRETYKPGYTPYYTTPAYTPAVQHKPVAAAEPESFNGIRPFIHSENETVETRLSIIGQNHAEKLAQATEIKNDLIANEQFTTSKLRKPEQAVSYTGGNGSAAAAVRAVRYEEVETLAPQTVTPLVEEKIPVTAYDEEDAEEIAPFVFRFNAGLFDFIISAFLSLILLSPFMMLSGNWFTMEGGLAFLVTCSIVMFLYITAAVGLIGRTLGMGLFSLEMIDAEDSDYPTFHQAAVSSSVYLVSLALGGIGFATMFWNEERRAVHDLVSGTVVVRES